MRMSSDSRHHPLYSFLIFTSVRLTHLLVTEHLCFMCSSIGDKKNKSDFSICSVFNKGPHSCTTVPVFLEVSKASHHKANKINYALIFNTQLITYYVCDRLILPIHCRTLWEQNLGHNNIRRYTIYHRDCSFPQLIHWFKSINKTMIK